jgi:hypothetical protein
MGPVSEQKAERCLTSSQTIPHVLPALMRPHPAVTSCEVAAAWKCATAFPAFPAFSGWSGRVGELKGGGGEAGGAGGFPAGWKPTFRDGQDGHPPSGRLASYAATPTTLRRWTQNAWIGSRR